MDEDRIEVVDKYDNVREQNPFGTIYDTNSENEKKKKNLKLGGLIAAVIFIIILLIIIIGAVGRKVIQTPLHWNSNKLPTTYSPQSYNITLNIDATNKMFSGYELINIELRNKTNLLVLHGDSIDLINAEIVIVESFSLDTSNAKFISADQISYDPVNGYILMRFEVLKKIPLYNGVTLAQLRLKFTGTIREDNRGIFITTYDDQNGNEQAIIATQFEPTNARLAFPCFDEPNIRANFTLTLVASNDFVTFISSTLVDKKTSDSNYTTVSFKTTPKINPSIFAFVISNFQKTTDKVDGVDVSVYVAEGKLLQAVTALSNVKKIVTFYNQYFGIVMPSKKLDIVCIPDFSPKGKIDGTYNWGLITMLETDVLVDQYSLTFQTQQNMLNLAREISRQWIGSLFGVKWWNSIWIIDGMSGFFQYLVVDSLQPKWDIWRTFRDDYENALFYDSLKYTHPLEIDETKIANQYDIESLYDDITKNKGASIFHMIYDRLESIEVGLFRTCVSDFLKNFAGASVNSNDLWESFQKSSDFAVKDFINDWTFKEGYPIVHFEKASNTTLRAIQEQFFMYTTKEESKYWWISLTLQYDSKISAVTRIKFNHTTKSSTFNSYGRNNSYFIVNPLRVGFYRVAYSPSMIDDIVGNIKKNGINYYQSVDISSILYDTLSIRRSSEDAFLVSISNLFDLALLVSNSTDYSLWNSVTDVFSILERLLDYPDSSSNFYKFVRHFTAPVFNKLGFLPKANDTTEINILRSVILPFVVKFNVGGSSATAYQMFKNFVANSSYILSPDIRQAIYIAGIKYGNADDWDWMKKQYQATDSKVEALRFLNALSATEDEELVQTAFNLILASEIDYHDIIPFLSFLSINHKNESWAFFESNWNFFVSNFPSQLDSLIILFSHNFVSHEQYVALKDLIRKYQYPLSDPLKQNYALIESNVGFFLNYASGVDTWLDDWNSNLIK